MASACPKLLGVSTAPDIDAAGTRNATARKRVLLPMVIGALLLFVAIGFTLAGDDLSFVPFLSMILGGACLGISFVNATRAMASVANGLILHVAVTITLSALLLFMTEYGSALLAEAPEIVGRTVLPLQMAAIPATLWLWLGLLSRVLRRAPRGGKVRAQRVRPEWIRDDSGDGSLVRFAGIPLRMRTLIWTLTAVVTIVGLGCATLLIALDDTVMRMGHRLAIFALGLVIGLPVYLLVMAWLRRRTARCVVAFGNDELRVQVGESTHRIPFRDLDYLRWRASSEYARIEVRGAGVDLSLFAGLAKARPGFTAELPELPRRVLRRFEMVGLTAQKARGGQVVTFGRLPADVGEAQSTL